MREQQREGRILRYWVICLWTQAGLKSVGQAGKLEIQGRFDVAILNPNSAGQSVGNSGRVPVLHS